MVFGNSAGLGIRAFSLSCQSLRTVSVILSAILKACVSLPGPCTIGELIDPPRRVPA